MLAFVAAKPPLEKKIFETDSRGGGIAIVYVYAFVKKGI